MEKEEWLKEELKNGALYVPEEFASEKPEEEILYGWDGGVLHERK